MGKTTHSKANSTEYCIYMNMRQRCNNENHPMFKDYGGRGISISKEWNDSFIAFFKDMGKRPVGKTLDRINNDKGYSKDNCKWATDLEQRNNKRKTRTFSTKGRVLTAYGFTGYVSDWAKLMEIPPERINYRISKGMDMFSAVFNSKRSY